MKRSVTIHDVAKISGFSKATVSRVLNNDPHVQEETRTIIRDVMLKLQYEPNNIARSLSRKRTGTIGVILEDITNPFYTEIARAIETVLQRSGYSMFLTSSNWIEKRETELLKKFIQNRVDGILIVPIESEGNAVSFIR
ncbi:MAG TPA: LacI family DNA-binding transcriptional regulator, partial [Spirochaetia bacterium]|nr:LacI family DNA-binding transcriptional regulator [Spirochaetia bacterium]